MMRINETITPEKEGPVQLLPNFRKRSRDKPNVIMVSGTQFYTKSL